MGMDGDSTDGYGGGEKGLVRRPGDLSENAGGGVHII